MPTRHDNIKLIRATGLCYLCGQPGARTAEHVVPRCFYPGNLPNDTIALPAHRECNNRTHLDEEAFRDFLAAGIPPDHPAFTLWQTTWRSIKRPEAKKRQAGYFKSFINRWEIDENGKRVAHPQATTLSKERVNRVLAKVVRGIHYAETGRMLPARGIAWTVTQLARGDRGPTLANSFAVKDVVNVRWEGSDTHPNETIWLINLYGVETFMVETASVTDASREATTIDYPPVTSPAK